MKAVHSKHPRVAESNMNTCAVHLHQMEEVDGRRRKREIACLRLSRNCDIPNVPGPILVRFARETDAFFPLAATDVLRFLLLYALMEGDSSSSDFKQVMATQVCPLCPYIARALILHRVRQIGMVRLQSSGVPSTFLRSAYESSSRPQQLPQCPPP